MARDSQLYINSSQYQKLSLISSIITIFSVLSLKKSASLDIIRYLRSPDFHGLYENKQLGKYDLSAINSSWNYEEAASLIILAQPQRILFA